MEPLNLNNLLDQVDGHLDYAYVYDNSGNLYYTATFEERRFCSYPTISQAFPCPGYPNATQKQQFFIKFTGIDQFGNSFQRYGSTYCLGTAHCVHGWLYNGQCNCESFWEGNDCSTPVCLNGGQPSVGQECQCPADFAGKIRSPEKSLDSRSILSIPELSRSEPNYFQRHRDNTRYFVGDHVHDEQCHQLPPIQPSKHSELCNSR